MQTIKIPYYYDFQELSIEEDNLVGVLTSRTELYNSDKNQEQLVREALKNPIGTKRLCELAKGKKKITLVTSDHTRAMPSKITLPIILEEIRSTNPDADITIFIATGLHRKTTEEEQRKMFGDNIVDHERIVVNEAFRNECFRFIDILPSGAELWVNKEVLECDLLVCEGFIEPHFFAGFSGGRKSILPGCCNATTVNQNHSYHAIANPYAKPGILEHNPIHRDMVYAARRVATQFILNVALNDRKEIIAAFSGDLEAAHKKGVAFVRNLAQCRRVEGDIVITSNGGYPLDQNLYQSPKALTTAAACCNPDGVIILCCSCCDGFGGTNFKKLMTYGKPDEIDTYISKIPGKQTISEQWCAQAYSHILQRTKVILVTTFLDSELVRSANLIPAYSVNEALEIAYQIMGKNARVVVIPDGVSVLVDDQ